MYKPSQTTIDQYVSQHRADYNTGKGANPLVRAGLAALLTVAPVVNISCNGPNGPNNGQSTTASQNSGAQPNQQKSFYNKVDNNPLLNRDEKARAKRMYDFVHSDVAKAEIEGGISRGNPIYHSGLYDKWGLGKKNGLSLEEQAYVSAIGIMEGVSRATYEMKQVIKNKKLSDEQKDFLRKMHEDYGNPIRFDQAGDAKSRYVDAFVKALFGGPKLTDAQILALNGIFGALEAVPNVLNQ